ncbi:hypothetical protein ABK040_004296 [Willaertia magna]
MSEPNHSSVHSVVLYSGASNNIHEKYFKAAELLGETFAKHNVTVKYGAGSIGLMGTCANACMKNGGKVIGIIPKFMVDRNWCIEKQFVTDIIVTDTMHERKQKMISDVDACVALPGGVGTFEELIEAITWKQLGLFDGVIVIVNVDNYFEHILKMIEKAIEEGFMTKENLNLFTVIDDPSKVIEAIQKAKLEQTGTHFEAKKELI